MILFTADRESDILTQNGCFGNTHHTHNSHGTYETCAEVKTVNTEVYIFSWWQTVSPQINICVVATQTQQIYAFNGDILGYRSICHLRDKQTALLQYLALPQSHQKLGRGRLESQCLQMLPLENVKTIVWKLTVCDNLKDISGNNNL